MTAARSRVVSRVNDWSCVSAGVESWQREGGGRERGHGRLLLASHGTHQAARGDGREGVRRRVRLPRKGTVHVMLPEGAGRKSLFTLPDSDSDSDCRPNGYIALCRTFHTAQTVRFRF